MKTLRISLQFAVGALLLLGCMFDTESPGDLPDGTYVASMVLDGPATRTIWKDSLRFALRHFEEIQVEEAETGTYRGGNDANNSRSKLIIKRKGTYSVRNDTLYLENRFSGVASILSYQPAGGAPVPYHPESFTSEDVPYSHRFGRGASVFRWKLERTGDGFIRTVDDASDARLDQVEFRKSEAF